MGPFILIRYIIHYSAPFLSLLLLPLFSTTNLSAVNIILVVLNLEQLTAL